ncbi:MAG: hypothetical protein ABII82_07955 [Verrucomicrobiota bacterium]
MIRLSSSLTALLLIALLAGCATPVRKLHPHELTSLPKTEGFYGGKILLPPPWLYQGSSDRHHRFLYTYTKGCGVYQIRIWVRRDELDVPFAMPANDMPANGIEVVLILDSATGRYGFAKPTPPNHFGSEWLLFKPEPEWTDAPPPSDGELRVRSLP